MKKAGMRNRVAVEDMAKKATASIAETISTDTAESEERKEGSHSGKTPYFVDRLTMAQDAGYTTVFWSLAYVDWDPKKQPSHKEALEKLKDMGYEIRPLSDLTETESQGGSCEKTDILLY